MLHKYCAIARHPSAQANAEPIAGHSWRGFCCVGGCHVVEVEYVRCCDSTKYRPRCLFNRPNMAIPFTKACETPNQPCCSYTVVCPLSAIEVNAPPPFHRGACDGQRMFLHRPNGTVSRVIAAQISSRPRSPQLVANQTSWRKVSTNLYWEYVVCCWPKDGHQELPHFLSDG